MSPGVTQELFEDGTVRTFDHHPYLAFRPKKDTSGRLSRLLGKVTHSMRSTSDLPSGLCKCGCIEPFPDELRESWNQLQIKKNYLPIAAATLRQAGTALYDKVKTERIGRRLQKSYIDPEKYLPALKDGKNLKEALEISRAAASSQGEPSTCHDSTDARGFDEKGAKSSLASRPDVPGADVSSGGGCWDEMKGKTRVPSDPAGWPTEEDANLLFLMTKADDERATLRQAEFAAMETKLACSFQKRDFEEKLSSFIKKERESPWRRAPSSGPGHGQSCLYWPDESMVDEHPPAYGE